jgi:hypothetical protein
LCHLGYRQVESPKAHVNAHMPSALALFERLGPESD